MHLPTVFGTVDPGNSHDGDKNTAISSKNVYRWKARLSELECSVANFFLDDLMRFWRYEPEELTLENIRQVSEFYDWYNINYFYRDSFSKSVT